VVKLLFTLVAIATVFAGSASAQACVSATPDCKESFAVGAYNFWYFRSFPLQTFNPSITRAVIVIHGMNRDADRYFEALTGALNNSQDPSLLVIAPHFKGYVSGSTTCNDALEVNELHWSCTGPSTSVNRWDDGGRAHSTGSAFIYSFSMIDRLLDMLNDATVFPNLQKITVTGHSDGAQFTQRYASGNQKDGTILPAVKYVIANPGSYMYLDNYRLPKGETCFADGSCTADFTTAWDPDNVCPDTYNNYKYGLDSRTFGYMSSDQLGFTDSDLQTRFLSRNIAYVMGELDQQNNFSLDVSCPATAQGSHLLGDGSGFVGGRRERGTIFWSRMQQSGATHTLAIIPACGHDETCMYNAPDTIQAILF